MAIAAWMAGWMMPLSREGRAAARPLAVTLLLTSLTYYLLNLAVFRFPWPWLDWTGRTPNALAFTLAVVVVLWVAVIALVQGSPARLLDSHEGGGQD